MEYGQTYYYIYPDGRLVSAVWLNSNTDNEMYNRNNVFQSREEALLESERRDLIVEIHRFRNHCNANNKRLDWNKFNQEKYFISYDASSGDLVVSNSCIMNDFNLFGYFATYDAAEATINFYGKKIKKLFCEVEK